MAFTFVCVFCLMPMALENVKICRKLLSLPYRVTAGSQRRQLEFESNVTKIEILSQDSTKRKGGKICENVCMSNLISKQIERQQLRPAVAAILWPKSERISKQDIRSTSICVCRAEPNRTEQPLMMINTMPLPLEAASSATFSCDDKTFSVFSKYQLDSLETILKSGVPVL